MLKHRLVVCLGALALTGCASDARVAQLERRVDSLAVTLTAVVNVRQRANGPAPAESATVAITGAGSEGAAQAPVIIVEFTDYQCPFCARHFQQTLPQLKQNYISTGRVRYVVRDLPLQQIHRYAVNAAKAARCAGQTTNSYWRYHDALFTRQKEIADTLFPRLARDVGLDLPKFRTCMASGETGLLVERDVAEAKRVGLAGTPAFVIGRPRADGSVHGVLIRGAFPYQQFQEAIDSALRGSIAQQ